jgi:hypothetical protein
MHTGSCLCGSLKYEFEGEPAMKVSPFDLSVIEPPDTRSLLLWFTDTAPILQAICHCLSCRKLSGSTFTTNILVPEAKFKITSKSQPKNSFSDVHEAGMKITPEFCAECGTAVMKKLTGPFLGMVIVQCGTLDDKDELALLAKPDAELWIKYRVPWLAPIEGTQQCQEFS